MKSLASIGSSLWAHVLILLAFICTGHSFKQELWLYDAQNTSVHFESHVPDTSEFNSFLPKVTRICARGRGLWTLFSTANYGTFLTWGGYNTGGSEIHCESFTEGASLRSLRHSAASETDTEALSLYFGGNWSDEVFVTGIAHIGITDHIGSLALTGTSDWTLFEGQALDGKSICYKVLVDHYVKSDHVSTLGLTTIGSVVKTCDAQEIQNYKSLLHQSSFGNSQ